jgi:EmrB/QacA subfamily drug resistance transporter
MRASRVLGLVSVAVFLVNLDLFIVNVAFPDISREWPGSSIASLSWVLNGYAIAFAALLVPAGRLADRYGRREGFLLGVATFTVGSALCAVAPGLWPLVAARVLQATGAAALIPTSLGLLLTSYPPAERARAVRIWAAVGGVAAAAGPVVGGLLVASNWRWIFVVNTPIGLATLLIGPRVLPASTPQGDEPTPDAVGAVLLTVAIGALALGLVKGGDWGWTSAAIGATAVVAVAGLTWFLRRSRTHVSPLVELPLLRMRSYAGPTLAALLFTVAFSSMLLSLVLYMSQVWHWSALRLGLAAAPGPLMVPPVAVSAGRLVQRYGAGRVAALGCTTFAVGVSWWAATIDLVPGYASGVLPGLLLTGLGVGLALPTLIGAATASLPPARFATGSALVTMARQIGAVFGVAVLVAVLGRPETADAAAAAFDRGWLWTAGAAVAAALASLTAQPHPAG